MKSKSGWARILLVVCLCASMATVGLMTLVPGAEAKPSQYAGITVPNGNPVTFSALSNGGGHGVGGKVSTNGSSAYNYDFMGYYQTPIVVGSARAVVSTGWFQMYDSYADHWPAARHIFMYVLNSTKTDIVGQCEILDDRDFLSNLYWPWRERTGFVGGLTEGSSVYVGWGRADLWSTDWRLTLAWAGVQITSPANPAWPHQVRDDSYSPHVDVPAGVSFVTMEYFGQDSIRSHASAITAWAQPRYTEWPRTTAVDSVRYIDQAGTFHNYGAYFGGGSDFVIPFGASFQIHASEAATIHFGYIDGGQMSPYNYPAEPAETFTQSLVQGTNNWVGRMYDNWWTFGFMYQPDHMMPLIPVITHVWASYYGAMIKAPGGGAFTGNYQITAWNTTSQNWMHYNSTDPGSDFALDSVPGGLNHQGLQVSVSAAAQITWSVA